MRPPIRALAASGLLVTLCACTVVEYQYPKDWQPLAPAASEDCRRLEGNFADRGEAGGPGQSPSLTQELFGPNSRWKEATSVRLSLPANDRLEVTVAGREGTLLAQTFTARGDEFLCKSGRIVVRGKRWIATDLVMGRQGVVIEMSEAPKHLVVKVNEETYGTLFVLVPIAGTAQHWYRFARLAP